MKITKKCIVFFVTLMMILPIFSMNVYADTMSTKSVETINKEKTAKSVDNVAKNTIKNNSNSLEVYNNDKTLPKTDIKQATNWATRKGTDVVYFLQNIVKPLAIAVFIICGLITLFGAIGGKGYVSKGLVGLCISVIIFTATSFAPEIVEYASRWLAS